VALIAQKTSSGPAYTHQIGGKYSFGRGLRACVWRTGELSPVSVRKAVDNYLTKWVSD
jgi:hypothetical protein